MSEFTDRRRQGVRWIFLSLLGFCALMLIGWAADNLLGVEMGFEADDGVQIAILAAGATATYLFTILTLCIGDYINDIRK
ncbi:hypothetical protein M9978_22910 [Sphingomonas sp. MG17]|uniref:Uncharacterized protein n=1 Tax=Sphingomonas tagetis TaxID=2949092 RepID=A0A9X2HPV7_9SPHN|nr:hypothetical protein [Sphingomonas tagetis]MCP3733259.1 hypothetical protein [Sphingomonas tagetis]